MEIITNLLDRTVKGKSINGDEVLGKICAIFHPGINGFSVTVANFADGKLHTCYSNGLALHNDKAYYVRLIADMPIQKIAAIKCIRTITNMGLAEAKAYVEAHPHRIIVSKDLTYDEATGIQNRVKDCDMESVILEYVNSITQE